jgi:hypothetical protein
MRAQVTNNAAGIGDQRRSRKPQVRREGQWFRGDRVRPCRRPSPKGPQKPDVSTDRVVTFQWIRLLAQNDISFAIAIAIAIAIAVAGAVKK